jgi:acetate kinase
MTDAILVLNAGSSSLKFAVYPYAPGSPPPILRGKIAGIGTNPVFSVRKSVGVAEPKASPMPLEPSAGLDVLIPKLLDWLNSNRSGVTIRAAGHRATAPAA